MKKVKLVVTEKGEKAPNKWKKGQEISVFPGTAEQLVKRGFATEKGESKPEKKEK